MTFGVCADCGAVAWELLSGQSDYCIGCDPTAYQHDDEYDDEHDDEYDSADDSAAA